MILAAILNKIPNRVRTEAARGFLCDLSSPLDGHYLKSIDGTEPFKIALKIDFKNPVECDPGPGIVIAIYFPRGYFG